MSDRHLKYWPAHAAHRLSAPATTLFYNAEVSARRYPNKPFLVFYDTRGHLFGISRRSAAHCRLSRARMRRAAGRPGSAVHAKQPPVRDRLLRHPAGERRGGAHQSHEPDRGSSALRAGCRGAHRDRLAGTLRARRTARRSRARPRARADRRLFRLCQRTDRTQGAGLHRAPRGSKSTLPASRSGAT